MLGWVCHFCSNVGVGTVALLCYPLSAMLCLPVCRLYTNNVCKDSTSERWTWRTSVVGLTVSLVVCACACGSVGACLCHWAWVFVCIFVSQKKQHFGFIGY